MEMHFANKFLQAHQKSHVIAQWEVNPDSPADRSHSTASDMLWLFGNVRAKSVIKVFLYNCLPEMSYTTAFPNSSICLRKQWPHSLCFICSLWGASNLLYIKLLYSVASTFLSGLYQEVTILFSLTRWMETVLVHKCFMWYSNFVHKLNSQLWMETQLLRQ